jgi:hypothetical protein
MVFCIVSLHLWGRVFGKFLDTKGLAYADDGSIIAKLSIALKIISMLASIFKKMQTSISVSARQRYSLRGPRQTII